MSPQLQQAAQYKDSAFAPGGGGKNSFRYSILKQNNLIYAATLGCKAQSLRNVRLHHSILYAYTTLYV